MINNSDYWNLEYWLTMLFFCWPCLLPAAIIAVIPARDKALPKVLLVFILLGLVLLLRDIRILPFVITAIVLLMPPLFIKVFILTRDPISNRADVLLGILGVVISVALFLPTLEFTMQYF